MYQLVEIQLIQVGDEHDLDLKKRAIKRRTNYVAKTMGTYLQNRVQ